MKKEREDSSVFFIIFIFIVETNKGDLAGKKSNLSNDGCAGLTYDEFLKAWNAVINLEVPSEKFEDDPICQLLHEDDLPKIVYILSLLFYDLKID